MPTRKTPALQRMCVMRLIFNLYSPIITLPWLQVDLLWLQSVHVATLFNVSSFTTHHPARSCSLSLLSEDDRDLDNSTPSSQFALGFQVKRVASAAIGISCSLFYGSAHAGCDLGGGSYHLDLISLERWFHVDSCLQVQVLYSISLPAFWHLGA
jgi:hypothetical protein